MKETLEIDFHDGVLKPHIIYANASFEFEELIKNNLEAIILIS